MAAASRASPGALDVNKHLLIIYKLLGKESICKVGDLGSIPGSGRSPGGGHGNPLKYSCLENPLGRGLTHTPAPRVLSALHRCPVCQR